MRYGVVYPKINLHENLLHEIFLTQNIRDLRYKVLVYIVQAT
jgi:hypothetical protein